MPFVNLIQEQRLAIKRDERTARTYFAVFAGAAAGAICVFVFLLFACEQASASESKLNATKQKNAPLVRQIAENEQQTADLQPRLTTLGQAQQATERWGRILKHLATQVPASAWLTGVRALNADPTKPVTASIDGLSVQQSPVSELMYRLENSPDLENVNLKFTQEKMQGTLKQTSFQIDADIVGTAIPKVEDKKQS